MRIFPIWMINTVDLFSVNQKRKTTQSVRACGASVWLAIKTNQPSCIRFMKEEKHNPPVINLSMKLTNSKLLKPMHSMFHLIIGMTNLTSIRGIIIDNDKDHLKFLIF